MKRSGNHLLRPLGILLAIALSVLVVISGMAYVKKISVDGQGYASKVYRESALLQRTRSIPPDITVYTNLMLPIVLYTGRITYRVPLKVNNSTQRLNETYDSEMNSMASDIRDSSALLVYFSRGPNWFVLPTVEEIGRYVPLHTLAKENDGGVYEAFPDTMGE